MNMESESEDNCGTSDVQKSKFDHPVYKQLSALNGQINTYTKEELINKLRSLRLDTDGKKTVLAKRLKNFYKKMMLQVALPHERGTSGSTRPCFDYYVVIDFEATCELIRTRRFKQEIIEFPAILVNGRNHVNEDEFRFYCRPVINPVLSDFCRELTGIKQEDVDSAPLFAEVLSLFDEWISKHQLGAKHSFAIVADGPWDMGKFLKDQCMLAGVEFPRYCHYWVNIRKSFSTFYRTRPLPLQTMLSLIGLTFQGHAHCGLDDARNISFILHRLLQDGARVRFNEKLPDNIEGESGEEESRPFYINVSSDEHRKIAGKYKPNYPRSKSNKV